MKQFNYQNCMHLSYHKVKLWFVILCLLIAADTFSQKEGSFGQMEMNLPVRLTHQLGVSGSMGWNGLVGMGATFQYYISPHFGLDGGAGFALSGYKFGGRLRYLFLESNVSPLIGVGYIYSTGLTDIYYEVEQDNGTSFIYEVIPSSFIQIVGGVDIVVNNGFFVIATMGYAIQTNDNINILAGYPTEDSERAMRMLYGSGFVMEFGIGYIFSNKKGIGKRF